MKVALNKHGVEKLDVECGVCGHSTKHVVLTSVDLSDTQPMGPDDYFSWSSKYQTVQCQGCESVSFRRTSENSEDAPIQVGPDEWESDVLVEIFPNPNAGRLPLTDVKFLPSQVSRIYEETLKALNVGQSVLCGIGVRALIETVCKDKSATGGKLFERINDLVTQGVLTKEGAVILHKLRTLGNDAAHEVKPHTSEQLGLAMDVVDHLLQGVYILPIHAANTFK